MTGASFTINEVNRDRGYVLIEDVGPWDKFPTVTNAAAWVVEQMFATGEILEGERLFYIDSEGNTDEILIKGRRFAGFAPARQGLP